MVSLVILIGITVIFQCYLVKILWTGVLVLAELGGGGQGEGWGYPCAGPCQEDTLVRFQDRVPSPPPPAKTWKGVPPPLARKGVPAASPSPPIWAVHAMDRIHRGRYPFFENFLVEFSIIYDY